MAELVFNPETGLEVPATEDVRADLVARIQEAFQTKPTDPLLNCEPSSPMGQVVDLIAAEIEAKNAEIAFLSNMSNPNSATGKFLDALAALYGIDRKISEPSLVTVTVTGLNGTVIPFGAIAEDASGNQFRQISPAGIRIGSSGTATGTFAAINHGALEVPAGAVTKIITVIAGWDTITNPTAGVVGRDEETDSELRSRVVESYAINATGYVEAIQANLAELDGVIAVRVLENYTSESQTMFGISVGAHSIAVCIVGGDDAEIAETIYRRKDAGCGTTGTTQVSYDDEETGNTFTYNIVRPSPVALKIQVEFFAELADDTIAAIKSALIADVLGQGGNPRVGMAETIFSSRFYPVVQSVTDTPVKAISIALGSGSLSQYVTSRADQEPVIEAADITVQVVTV